MKGAVKPGFEGFHGPFFTDFALRLPSQHRILARQLRVRISSVAQGVPDDAWQLGPVDEAYVNW